MLIGYARVSTTEQNVESQIDAIHEACYEKIFAHRADGDDTIRRPELNKLIEQLRKGDTVVFTALDRLARNLRFLLDILETIKQHGAGIKSLNEPIIDTSTPIGEFALQIFGVIAEFERQRIRQRIQAGVRHARKSGKTARASKGADKGKGRCHYQIAPTGDQHRPTVQNLRRKFPHRTQISVRITSAKGVKA